MSKLFKKWVKLTPLHMCTIWVFALFSAAIALDTVFQHKVARKCKVISQIFAKNYSISWNKLNVSPKNDSG